MKTIEKRPLRVIVREHLEEAIIEGELKPGDKIIETKVAKELGVSQSPVREAINDLISMGLLEKKDFSGTRVRKLSKKEVKNAYDVRAYLEMLAVSEATKNITDKELNEMENLLVEMKKFAQDEDVQKFVDYDIKFHEKIMDVSGNKLLKKIWNMVYLSQWTFITTKISKRSLLDLANRHELICASLKNKNSLEASKNMKIHIEELAEEVLSDWEKKRDG
jgi:DNA-binding GntR family transcriptional regulator